MAKVVGIDLGTANSGAFYRDGENHPKEILPREGRSQQGKGLPSFVEFNQDGTVQHVGKMAYDDYCNGIDAPNIWGTKRLIGSSYEEAMARREFRHLDYAVKQSDDGGILIPINGIIDKTPVEIAVYILNKIKEDALNPQLNTLNGIDRVVITIPAYFDGSRKDATLRAVQMVFSNLPANEIDWVPEPTAAALGYGLQQLMPAQGGTRVCVIDLGAGTLDIVRVMLGRGNNGEVIMMSNPACGNAAFGGIDIDDILVGWAIETEGLTDFRVIREQMAGGEIANTLAANNLRTELRQLRAALETAKIHLSDLRRRPQETVNYSYKGEWRTVTLTREIIDREMDRPLSQERVNELIGYHLNDEEERALLEALKRYHPAEHRVTPSFLDLLRLNIENGATKDNHTINDIDHILLVGGPMHMPCIRKTIQEVFATNRNVMDELQEIEDHGFPVDPMQCVAMGAALYVRDINPPSSQYYAAVNIEFPNQNGKTEVYCYPENYLAKGIFPPIKRSVQDSKIKSGIEVQVEPITILEGHEGVFNGVTTKHWKKCRTYQFRPVFVGGKAKYNISLDMNDKQAVTVIVEDLNLKELRPQSRPYDFIAMEEEELPPDKYEVIVGEIKLKLTYGLIPPIYLEGKMTCAKAQKWLDEKHDPEDENNRPSIEEYQGILQNELPMLLSIAQGKDPNMLITDPEELSLFDRVIREIRELIRLINLITTISGNMISAARNSARALSVKVSGLDDSPTGDLALYQQLQQKNEELMDIKLPYLKEDEWTKNPDIINAYIVYSNRIDELNMALDAYNETCHGI